MTEQSRSRNHLVTAETIKSPGPGNEGKVWSDKTHRWKNEQGMPGMPDGMKSIAPKGGSAFALAKLARKLTLELVIDGAAQLEKALGDSAIPVEAIKGQDLEPEPRSSVVTTHFEEDSDDTPGFVPSGNPGIRSEDADFESEKLNKSLANVEEMLSLMAR